MLSPTKPPVSAGDRLLQVLRDRCVEVATGKRKFPTEPQLSDELGVSRPLLREALARLEHEGLLRRRRGHGTSVNVAAAGIRFWFDRQETFADLLERNGFSVVHDVLSVGFAKATQADIDVLGVDADTWMVAVRKRWRADERVVIVADNFIAVPPGMHPDEISDPARNLFHLSAELYGEEPEWEIARPIAAITDPSLRDAFELQEPEAVFSLRLLGLGVSGVRLYRNVEYYLNDGLDWSFVRTFRPL